MSKKLLTILLSELKTVRIKCKSCGGVAELDVVTIEKAIAIHCPSCARQYRGGDDGLLKMLSKLIRLLPDKLAEEEGTIEFVLDDPC